MGGVAIQDWTVSVGNLSGVVQDDNLGGEVGNSGCWLVLGVGCNISSLDVLHGNILDVESNVVSGVASGRDS